MGYLTNRRLLSDLAELYEYLPEGWTMNTPCVVYYEELEDFREVSHSNGLFQNMLATGNSIYQVLNGPGWEPNQAEILREQKVAAQSWAEALDDEVGGWQYHHPHETGAYVHTMWSRANKREEVSQAIFAVDVSDSSPEFKDQFCDWVQNMARERHAQTSNQEDSKSWSYGNAKTGGVSRAIVTSSMGLYMSTRERRWCRWGVNSAKPKGKTLADKRRSLTVTRGGKRCKAMWR